MDILNTLGRAVDQSNIQIDEKAQVSSTDAYLVSLNLPQQGKYLVRPDGSIEFIKNNKTN